MIKWQKKYKQIKNFLLGIWSKEFLVFFFFLAITTALWFMSALNDTYETDISVALRLDNVPTNVVVTDDLPDTVKVTIRDKGFNLLQYMLSEVTPLQFSFAKYGGKNGRGNVSATDVQRLLRLQLLESSKIVTVKADHWDFYYIKGVCRRLPILMGGQPKAKSDYYITHMSLIPDSVDVYATVDAFDTLKAVYTEPFAYDGVTSSFSRQLMLQHVYGTKYTSAIRTTLTVSVDELTEVVVSVPIRTINVPNDVQIKTFPARVDVRVSVGCKYARFVKADQFYVVVDYNDMPKDGSSHFPLKLLTQPKDIVKAYLKFSEVDYIIEHI